MIVSIIRFLVTTMHASRHIKHRLVKLVVLFHIERRSKNWVGHDKEFPNSTQGCKFWVVGVIVTEIQAISRPNHRAEPFSYLEVKPRWPKRGDLPVDHNKKCLLAP